MIAFAEDRTACVARLRGALEATEIVGVPTNLGFLLEILGHPDVVDGRVDTDWIERTWHGHAPALPDGVRATEAADERDPWRAFGPKSPASGGVVVAGGWALYRGWGVPAGGRRTRGREPAAARRVPHGADAGERAGPSMSPRAIASPWEMRWWCWKR